MLVAALLPYTNALRGAHVSDGIAMIEKNRALLESREWLAWLGRDFYWGSPFQDTTLYRPLTVWSFLAQLRTTGLDPFYFLLVNVALHCAVSLLVLLLGRRLVGEWGALVGGLLFAVHPIHTEAVSWIMGRSELLAALFALAACLLWLSATDPEEPRRLAFAGAGAGCYLAALASKEHVALLPLWLLAVPLLDRRRLRPALIAAAPALAALGAFLLARSHALTRAPEIILDGKLYNPASVVGAPQRVLTAVGVIGRYAGLALWPARLSHDYSYAQVVASSGVGATEAAGLLVVAAVLGALIWGARRAPGMVFALALAPPTFFLVSNVPFAIGTIQAERLTYLPSAGILLAAGFFVAPLVTRTPGRIVLVLALAALGARTFARNPDWRSDAALYHSALLASPRSAHVKAIVAEQELATGNVEQASVLAHAALEIYPDYYDAHIALAKVHVARGEYAPAAEEVRKALPMAPRNDHIRAQLHNNLGAMLSQLGRTSDAEGELREAIRLDGADVVPRIHLIDLLARTGRASEASRELRLALGVPSIRPDLIPALAAAARSLGDDQALAELSRRSR